MVTEETLASYSLDELFQLLKIKLAMFDQLEAIRADRKTLETARIELDLIEYVVDERKKITPIVELSPRPT
jgi:hypothetical protein